ncbi:hypothetical protein I5532_11850 [Citrobacter freundii]|uniref:hypothetical protein n=1 Tax=Citrobacter freundii TaxID=546 RepID=UPI001904A0DE|nr:hypothetical protein [Citrobacter freundii]MBJ9633329.1 hypothetical protein [Citrobacter freundii]
MANIIVTKTINMVEWSVDKTSYGKALKAIKSLKAAQEKPAKALEAAKKRTAQSEGKAALAAAKAHTTECKPVSLTTSAPHSLRGWDNMLPTRTPYDRA